jgi:hypothetical protein
MDQGGSAKQGRRLGVWRTAAWAAVLAGLLAAAVGFVGDGSGAQPDPRSAPPPTHFKSGGERSEAVLIEIAASLKRIEVHLERLQQVAERWGNDSKPAVRTERKP